MMMMTPGKFKVLKQPIFSIGFFKFVIMDDDELNSFGAYREKWISGATLPVAGSHNAEMLLPSAWH